MRLRRQSTSLAVGIPYPVVHAHEPDELQVADKTAEQSELVTHRSPTIRRRQMSLLFPPEVDGSDRYPVRHAHLRVCGSQRLSGMASEQSVSSRHGDVSARCRRRTQLNRSWSGRKPDRHTHRPSAPHWDLSNVVSQSSERFLHAASSSSSIRRRRQLPPSSVALYWRRHAHAPCTQSLSVNASVQSDITLQSEPTRRRAHVGDEVSASTA